MKAFRAKVSRDQLYELGTILKQLLEIDSSEMQVRLQLAVKIAQAALTKLQMNWATKYEFQQKPQYGISLSYSESLALYFLVSQTRTESANLTMLALYGELEQKVVTLGHSAHNLMMRS